mmetsp:Transcript_7289/g.16917  ORF Transcript_7289/g.16917 Transcript_7289/m.16917 type:complete len:81 (+) Transcript_7289:105-347(+)
MAVAGMVVSFLPLAGNVVPGSPLAVVLTVARWGVALHLLTGGLSARIAQRKGRDPLASFIRGFFSGFMTTRDLKELPDAS